MTAALPSIPQAVIQAYRDLVHSIRTLRPLVGTAFLILLAAGIIQHLLRLDDETERSRLLIGFLLGAAQQFLLMPYYLAVHRLVILDEATRSYRLAPREPGFQRFYWLSLAFDFLLFLPTMMMPLLASLRIRYQVAFFMIAFFVTAYVFLRLIVIFPGFAVDAPGATLKNAYADTKGNSWRTLGIILLAHLPFIPVLVALAMLVGDPKTGRSPSIVMDVAGGAIGVLLVTLLIVIASRLYMSIGDRTKGSSAG